MTVKLIALIVPLGLDTFAVAAALGVAGLTSTKQRVRVSLLMASFEGGMPLVGLALGAPLGHALGSAADYIAVGVLVAFGLYTLLGADDEAEVGQFANAHGWAAVALGLSISLDELAIGFTLGLLRVPVVLVVALIALQAFLVSQLGLHVGARLSARAREGAERVAGFALVALGVGLLAEKLA